MKIEDIQQLIGLGTEMVQESCATLFSVLTKPQVFYRSIALETTADLLRASRFAALMSVLTLVIQTPVYRLVGVETESTAYLLTDTVLTYAAWFLYGSVLHLAAKILRGHGAYQSSVAAFLYLTAFFPVMAFFLLPCSVLARQVMLRAPDTFSLGFFQALAQPFLASPLALTSFGLATGVGFYFFGCLILAARRVHGFGWVRGLGAGVLAFLGWLVISLTVVAPVDQLFQKAFLK
jgi:hypothetical protein